MATYLHFHIYLIFKSQCNTFISLRPREKKKEKQLQQNMFLRVWDHILLTP